VDTAACEIEEHATCILAEFDAAAPLPLRRESGDDHEPGANPPARIWAGRIFASREQKVNRRTPGLGHLHVFKLYLVNFSNS